MEKGIKKLILGIFLIVFIIAPFISALEVECTSPSQCSSNELCFNYECVQAGEGGAGEEIGDEEGPNISNREAKEDINTNNNSTTSALIIGIAIIVGLAILGLILRRRK